MTPDGAEWAPRPRIDNVMVKALARAFCWRKMLDGRQPAELKLDNFLLGFPLEWGGQQGLLATAYNQISASAAGYRGASG